jgi:hypothetical protein
MRGKDEEHSTRLPPCTLTTGGAGIPYTSFCLLSVHTKTPAHSDRSASYFTMVITPPPKKKEGEEG